MKMIIIFGIFLVIILNGCTSESPETSMPGEMQDPNDIVDNGEDRLDADPGEENKISLDEIARHNSPNDCWLAINSRVYDVTDYVMSNNHPGGEAILEGCGKDATELFNTRPMGSGTPHSQGARAGLENYYIGELGS